MKFDDLLKELEGGKTFEDICREKHAEMVECIGNVVYDDQDLYDFLEDVGAEISDYGVGYAVIETKDGKTYEVPYEERENRFDPELPDETLLFFDIDRIYDVTECR